MRVRVLTTTHAGLMPGDEGEYDCDAFKGVAVKFNCVRSNARDAKEKEKTNEATVYLKKGEYLMLPEAIEGNPS